MTGITRFVCSGLAVLGLTIVFAGATHPLAAQLTPVPRAPKAVAAAKVIGFQPLANPKTFSGPCPATITFNSVINANQYPVSVDYQWERSDGATGPKQTVKLEAKGTSVSDTWQLGGSGDHLSVWEKVHVLSPNDISSGKAMTRLTCKK
jgi:hypothetical protein